jgi:hypothetical protein
VEKIGDIEIRVVGKSGNLNLSPDNYDIKQIAYLLQNVEDLLYPTHKKDRPIITYDIQEGSVRHIFKTSIQAVIGFSALLSQIQSQNNIDFLELKINPSTKFFRTENTWVDAEFYFYGILKDAGGKSKANIHIDTSDYGYLSIETGEEFLKEREDNLLYKNYGVRATGKQNMDTGEVDTKSLKLVELIDYNPKFDNDYLKTLINKAKNNWKGINADDWLINMRGGYEA